MDDGLKQRLIGALVLIALALVFLPTLFHREQRIPVDQASQLPAKPLFEPVVIEPPPSPDMAQHKPVEQVFQPPIDAVVSAPNVETTQELKPAVTDSKSVAQSDAESVVKPDAKAEKSEPSQVAAKPDVVEAPALNSDGIAKSWVLQVASFKDQQRAQAFAQVLIDKGYRAFVRTSTIASGKVSRTFVGPHIDKKSALILKTQLDTEMKINSLVLEFSP